jgi:hypothetical protein
MAKKDLDIILKKIKSEIDANSDLRNELDTYKHEFSASTEQVYKEMLEQLNNLIHTLDSPTPQEVERRKQILHTLSGHYVSYLYTSLKQYSGKARMIFARGSNASSFRVLVSSPYKDSGMSIFGVINSIRTRKRGLPELREKILEQVFRNNKSDEVSTALFGSYRKDESGREIRSGGLLQLGHDKSGSVSLRRKAELLKKLSYKSNISRLLTGTKIDRETRAQIAIAVNTYSGKASNNLLKQFTTTVSLSEETAFGNQRDAAKEKSTLRSLKREIESVLRKDIDFFNQRGSASAVEIVTNTLIEAAVKAGAKSKRVVKSGNSKSKSKINIQGTTKRSKQSESVELKVPTSNIEQNVRPNTNWMQLIPIINARLTDKVMGNMQSPRLVNRTGRFAQSARVVNVEQTPQGFPSFVFDYERDPYDVFDRTLGRSPWNTPQRDPRTLVDQSIREIVREMAIGRFFTRRA